MRKGSAVVVLGLDESQWIESARFRVGGGLATQAAVVARGVADPVEGHGVADEAILDEDTRAAGIIAGIEAQLHLAAAELGADLQEAAAEADGGVLAYEATLAVEEDFVEILVAGQLAQVGQLGEPVLARHLAGRVVLAGMVLGGEPGPVFGVELGDGKRIVGQLVADLLAPGPVPALDHALGLAVPHARVQQADTELRADQHE